MSNKIEGMESRSVRVTPGSAASRSAGSTTAGKSDGSATGTGADVQITGIARHLAALEQSIRDLPAIDVTRVAAVQHRLEVGSYQVDPQRVADRLLRMDAELGHTF